MSDEHTSKVLQAKILFWIEKGSHSLTFRRKRSSKTGL